MDPLTAGILIAVGLKGAGWVGRRLSGRRRADRYERPSTINSGYPTFADNDWRNQKPTTASYWNGGGMVTYDTRTGKDLYFH